MQIVSSQIFTCKFEEIKFKIGIEISWDWNLICFRKKEARMRFDINLEYKNDASYILKERMKKINAKEIFLRAYKQFCKNKNVISYFYSNELELNYVLPFCV